MTISTRSPFMIWSVLEVVIPGTTALTCELFPRKWGRRCRGQRRPGSRIDGGGIRRTRQVGGRELSEPGAGRLTARGTPRRAAKGWDPGTRVARRRTVLPTLRERDLFPARRGVRTERWSPRGEWHDTAPAERYSVKALDL